MSKPRKPSFYLLLALLVLVLIAVLRPSLQPKERIAWRDDPAAAAAEAGRSQKPQLLYFTATWCGPCQSLKHTTFADARVEAALSKFVPTRIDIDQHPDLARQYEVEAIPNFVIIESPGDRPLRQHVGALHASDFLDWLAGKSL
jgi:thiol:disulfide interchange protein